MSGSRLDDLLAHDDLRALLGVQQRCAPTNALRTRGQHLSYTYIGCTIAYLTSTYIHAVHTSSDTYTGDSKLRQKPTGDDRDLVPEEPSRIVAAKMAADLFEPCCCHGVLCCVCRSRRG
jgi:hypothetical protein